MAKRLRKSIIENAKYEGDGRSRFAIWDGELPGFGVRVYPSGKKSFVLKYRVKGLQRMAVLGEYGSGYTLDQARADAEEWRAMARRGTDPQEARKAAQVKGRTFGELLAHHIENNRRRGNKTWKKDQRRFELYIPARLKSRPANEVIHADIDKLHKAAHYAPYEANRTLTSIRTAFNRGRHWEFGLDPVVNPADGVEKFPETKRKVWVRPHEMPYLARAIDEEPSIYVRGALWLYLLTGSRKSELLSVRRSEIERETGRIRLPDTKSGEEQSLPLSSYALAIIDTLPPMAGNPYLLPSPTVTGAHLVNISKPWDRVRRRATVLFWQDAPEGSAIIEAERERVAKTPARKHARQRTEPTIEEISVAAKREGVDLPRGFQHVRLHDLRRTAGSWLSSAGVELNTIREGLRHSDISTTLTYARLSEDAAAPAFEEHGRRLREAAGRAKPVGVVVDNA